MFGRSLAQNSQDLGNGADGDLRRRVRADVQSERRINFRQLFVGNATLPQMIENAQDFPPTPDHSDVARAGLLEGAAQSFAIDLMIAAHDDERLVALPLMRGDELRRR